MSFLILFSILFTFAMSDDRKPSPDSTVRANMQGASGSNVAGTVDFTETPLGVRVNYKLTGLNKNRRHGFHIHEKGDCSAPDAKSAGKHYVALEPTGGTSLDSPEKHAGDLPQILANKDGNAEGSFISRDLSVSKKNPVLGRAIIVHDGADDPNMKSPPRIGCGVIRPLTEYVYSK